MQRDPVPTAQLGKGTGYTIRDTFTGQWVGGGSVYFFQNHTPVGGVLFRHAAKPQMFATATPDRYDFFEARPDATAAPAASMVGAAGPNAANNAAAAPAPPAVGGRRLKRKGSRKSRKGSRKNRK